MADLTVCTPGGASDNSYLTATAADSWFAADFVRSAAWAALSTVDRQQALIRATADIENLGGPKRSVRTPTRPFFIGRPYDTDGDDQALHFPRSCDVDDDGTTLLIPDAVKSAVCEQAWYLIQQRDAPELLDHDALQASGVSSLSADGLSVSYGGTRSVPHGIAPAAWRHIKPYIRRTFGTAGECGG